MEQQQAAAAAEYNAVNMCQLGQDSVQELVQKTIDLFQIFKMLQLPNGTPQSLKSKNEKFIKMKDCITHIDTIFTKLKHIYDNCEKNMAGSKVDVKNLIPIENMGIDSATPQRQKSEREIMLLRQRHELELQLKRRREKYANIIEQLRQLVWECSTVLSLKEEG